MTSLKLLAETKNSGNKFFLQFGGQGSPYLKEMGKLYEEPLLKEFFQVAFDTIGAEEKRLGRTNLISQGLDIKSWLANPDSAPTEDYLCRGSVSVGMIFITQMANYHLLTLKGFAVPELMAASAGTTGHSQGIVSATLAALGKDGKDFYTTFAEFLTFIFYLGYRAQEQFPYFELEKSVMDGNTEIGDKNPAPMVACIGYQKDELEKRIDDANKDLNLTGQNTVYSIWDGRNFQSEKNLGEALFKEVVIKALHWDKAVNAILTNPHVTPVLDFGPSVVSSKLTGSQISAKGLSNQVLCAANPKDLKVILE
ncbi:MAG: hypothetical protein K8R21_11080 [Leptospira sp.]|nr:hypothetical protein [Leptospira sp.]